MKQTMSVLVNPRMAAERFGKSPSLAVMVFCLAFSCGLTMFSSMQNAMAGMASLGAVTLVFDLMYLAAGLAAVFMLWQLRMSVSQEKFKKAGVAALALGLVLLSTLFVLAVVYFSIYSVFRGLTAADMAEMEMTQQDLDQMWRLLPYIILSLACNALEGTSWLIFRLSLRRLGEMTMGKISSAGVFTACSVVSALAGGMILGRMLFDIMTGGSALQIVFAVLSCLSEAGVFAGMMLLCQGTVSSLRGN